MTSGPAPLPRGWHTRGRRSPIFRDREEAGRRLAGYLEHLKGENAVVLGLPRGGVPVAFHVARALGAALDVIVVRKLGVPYQPELGMGAIGEDGVRVLNDDVVSMTGVTPEQLAEVETGERIELERRANLFRQGRSRVSLTGRVAVIVDDGIATGSTARAAARVARALGASRVVAATPVAPPGVENRLGRDADEVIVAETPEPFFAIGQFYRDFDQVADGEVTDWLDRARQELTGPVTTSSGEEPPAVDTEVEVAGKGHRLGHLVIPQDSPGTVIFAHGSGSSRQSPRNRNVAETLNRGGLGSLLFDLLTPEEEVDRTKVFDIELLAGRLLETANWLTGSWPDVPIAFFGASTGAAAALRAAAALDDGVRAVVSRGGRPDLASPHLARVKASTLLIVGSCDTVVLDLNREAQAELQCENRLEVVSGASHLFEEPGTLDQVADLARDWFTAHFP